MAWSKCSAKCGCDKETFNCDRLNKKRPQIKTAAKITLTPNGEIVCPGIAEAKTGVYRCDPRISSWSVDGWDNGKGCVRKCEELGRVHGPGCCEARYKGATNFCVFGKFLAKGYTDSRAVNCKGSHETTFGLSLYKTNLIGHWDAMDDSSIIKDEFDFVEVWSDKAGSYDVKSSGQNRPEYAANAINGYPAINFTGSRVGLISDVKYSKSANQPFTWIMAVKTTSDISKKPYQNIFTTTGATWAETNLETDYFPVIATSHGIYSFYQHKKFFTKLRLPKDELQIYVVRFDGSKLTVSIGIPDPKKEEPVDWAKQQVGFVNMGRYYSDKGWPYIGFIGEILAYDIALDWPVLNNLVHSMNKKWNTGINWKKAARVMDFKDHSKASKCPLNFPDLEKHPNENHGDVCRKDKINGYDIGWKCPVGCTAVPDAMPYCKMSPFDNAPCRIKKATCCRSLSLSASESVTAILGNDFGEFKLTDIESNDHPVYKNSNGKFLHFNDNNDWAVGPNYTSTEAILYNPNCEEYCPNYCYNDWNYWANGEYVTDNSISISCELPEIKAPSACQNGDVKFDKDGSPMIFWNRLWSPICAHSFSDNRNGADRFCQKLGYATGVHTIIERNFTMDKFMVGMCLKDDEWPYCTGRNNKMELGSTWKDCDDNIVCGKFDTTGIKIQCIGGTKYSTSKSCEEYVPQNDASEIISKCARKNFEVEGHDMLEAKWLPELNVIECQELCKKIEGCQYFVSRIGSNQICQLKSGSAVKQWQDESISPHSYTYSGPAECDDLQPNDGKVCFQINVDIVGVYMNTEGDLLKKSPEECQNLCRKTIGCVWFTWKKVYMEDSGSCKLISIVREFASRESATGLISGPGKCGDLGFEQFCTSCYRCKEMLWGLGGGNHTIEECMRACQIQKDCKFLSFSSEGHCHMSSKCDDKKPGAPHWTTYRRICQGNCGKNEGPCFNHDDCKIGFHCGKDNCHKTKNFQKTSYDCCEESNDVFWNNFALPLRWNKGPDFFNSGDKSDKDKKISYKWSKLQALLHINIPLIGSQEIKVEGEIIVRIPRPMFVYMICFDGDENVCNTTNWIDTGHEGDFFGISHPYNASMGWVAEFPSQKIYRKILPAGRYIFDARKAAYLFQDDSGCPEGYRSIKGDMSGGVLDQYQCSFDKCRINCDVNDECKTFRYTHGEQYACTLISTETPDVLKTGDFTLCKKQAEGHVSWKLLAEQAECDDAEIGKGYLGDIRSCAEACVGISSLFIYGTNDFGGNRCDETGCNCICETAANLDGTCARIGHSGYRLFKHQPWPIFWNDKELPLRYVNEPDDKFLCDGSPCTDNPRYYKNLPNHIASRFPMIGTKSFLSSSSSNMLYLSQSMIAYHVQEAASNITKHSRNWIDTGYFGEYLGDGVFAKIYKRIFPPGLHKLDSNIQPLLFTKSEAASGNFYSIFNGKVNPIYNDFEDEYDEKLRLDDNLNEAVIGHWKSHDGNEEYYSKGSMIASIELYEKGFKEKEVEEAMERSQVLPSKNKENCVDD